MPTNEAVHRHLILLQQESDVTHAVEVVHERPRRARILAPRESCRECGLLARGQVLEMTEVLEGIESTIRVVFVPDTPVRALVPLSH